MKKENTQLLVFILIVFLIVISIIFIFSSGKSEVRLCQQVFLGLLTGRQSVENFLDWENIKVIGLNVGKLYSSLPDEKQKADYRKAFFKSLSVSFKKAGGRPELYTNWRIKGKNGSETIVAADYIDKAKTLLFTLVQNGRKKITLIQWEGEGEVK
jgi:hypothetical protein